MSKFSRTWWGQRFIAALESFTDSGRLQRGRSYAGPSRILSISIMAKSRPRFEAMSTPTSAFTKNQNIKPRSS
jgi:hypothetical protein